MKSAIIFFLVLLSCGTNAETNEPIELTIEYAKGGCDHGEWADTPSMYRYHCTINSDDECQDGAPRLAGGACFTGPCNTCSSGVD